MHNNHQQKGKEEWTFGRNSGGRFGNQRRGHGDLLGALIIADVGGGDAPVLYGIGRNDAVGRCGGDGGAANGIGREATRRLRRKKRRFLRSWGHCKGFASSPIPPKQLSMQSTDIQQQSLTCRFRVVLSSTAPPQEQETAEEKLRERSPNTEKIPNFSEKTKNWFWKCAECLALKLEKMENISKKSREKSELRHGVWKKKKRETGYIEGDTTCIALTRSIFYYYQIQFWYFFILVYLWNSDLSRDQ